MVTQSLIKSQKFQKISQQNKSETVTNENDKEIPKEIPKERYMSSEKKTGNYCWTKISIIV